MAKKKNTDLVLDSSSGDGAAGEPQVAASEVVDAVVLDEASGPVLHRDLSDIAVTDLGDIVINRTKRGTSPFVPIVKTPTYSQNSGTLSGYSVEIKDDVSETGYRHVGTVSKNYLLLSNEEVRELAIEIAMQSGLPFQESRIFWDGSRFLHVIDFEGSESVGDGDDVGLGLVTQSSYDKTWRYSCQLMGRRFVCDNGLISGEFFGRVAFKHLAAEGDPKEHAWQDVVRQGLSVIDRAPEDLHHFAESLRRLRACEMTDARLREAWNLFPAIGDGIKGQVMSRYVGHEEPTMFGLLQAATNVTWHREKQTASDYANNDAMTTALLRYAKETLA